LDSYGRIHEAGAKLRQNHFTPEFEFINVPLTPKDFKNHMGAMLDCLVIQEKPNDGLDM
jgi:hypothetical protein